MDHGKQGASVLRQLAIGALGATAILILVRVGSETDWSREMITALTRSSLLTGLLGFPLLFGVHMVLSAKARTPIQLGISFLASILVCVGLIALVVPTLNWLSGSMIAPNAPGDDRVDFIAFLAQYFLAVYWRLVAIMGPLFVAFNWHWFASRLDPPATRLAATSSEEADAGEHLDAGETKATLEENAEDWLIGKLAMPKRGRLWAISSELHYLRIYTDVADDLVLMRLSDAVERLSASDGIQIHRSHWVARAGISDVVKGDSGLEVELQNGVRLPVSRSNTAAVRAFVRDS